MNPTIGASVHFVNVNGQHEAALVIGIHGNSVDLQVFSVGAAPRQELGVHLSGQGATGGYPSGTCHWPEA